MLSVQISRLQRKACELTTTRQLCLSSVIFKKDDDWENNRIEIKKKLENLLQSIIDEKPDTVVKSSPVSVPKPREYARKKKELAAKERKESDKDRKIGERIVEAAKKVAKTMDGNSKKIEAELLHTLLRKNSPLKAEIDNVIKDNKSLNELLSGMKMEIEQKKPKEIPSKPSEEYLVTRSKQVKDYFAEKNKSKNKEFEGKRKPFREENINLFGGEPLNIFDVQTEKMTDEVQLKTWNKCFQRDVKLSATLPPSNIYEQMIIWTEKGIFWKFPINNEQGLDDEKNVSFAEHVLLEQHLENWCPETGPIRHFMELVCVGLSDNYWFTAEEKKAHILFYENYFTERKTLIKELGAGEISSTLQLEQNI